MRARWLSLLPLLAACGATPAAAPTDAATPRDVSAADVAVTDAGVVDDVPTADVEVDAGPPRSVRATTASGMVEGSAQGGVARFVGIPYAAPPVGALRWRAPTAPAAWSAPRDATQKGPACIQAPGMLLGNTPTAEDCLTLNVWTADTTPAPAARRPVMVFVHGGGFTGGHASGADYDGEHLARLGVTVVTFNYRLGQLGFLAHPALSAEAGANEVSGNYGFLDQQAALRWVRDNISAFGGDPGNVTVFGESAGSMAVSLHLIAPESRGLFHRAILESGSSTVMLTPLRDEDARAPLQSAYSLGRRFAEGIGCATASDVPGCMRAKSPAEVLAVLRSSNELVRFEARFQPVVDRRVILEAPWTAFHNDRFARVPIMLGTNRDEGTIFTFTAPIMTVEAYRAEVERLVPGHADEVLTRLYPPAMFPSVNAAFNAFLADAAFICPTRDLARLYAAAMQPVFLYHFTHETMIGMQLRLGVFHSAELPYVFNNWTGFFRARESDTPVVNLTQGYWTRFARGADPNGAGAVAWPRYATATDQHLDINAAPRADSGLRRSQCDVISAWLEPPR
jgi:para-nitrobenzyl esterase